jgi:hypothetical protein
MSVLAEHAEDGLVFMMNFVIFVEGGNFVEDPMEPHVDEVISNHDDGDLLYNFEMAWESFKSHADSCCDESNIDVEGEDESIVHQQVPEGLPFHLIPVVLLPGLLHVGLDLVGLIDLCSQVTGKVNEGEDAGASDVRNSGCQKLEEEFVLYMLGPNGLPDDRNEVEIGEEQEVGDEDVLCPLPLDLQSLDLPDPCADLSHLIQHFIISRNQSKQVTTDATSTIWHHWYGSALASISALKIHKSIARMIKT